MRASLYCDLFGFRDDESRNVFRNGFSRTLSRADDCMIVQSNHKQSAKIPFKVPASHARCENHTIPIFLVILR
jgi:hypothetical protein